MSKQKAKQPAIVLTHFAKELGVMLSEYLTDPNVAIQKKSTVVAINQKAQAKKRRIPLKDRLAVKLMLTLNKKYYRRNLLFRDYSLNAENSSMPLDNFYLQDELLIEKDKQKHVSLESVFYVQTVLSRPLEIIAPHESRPGNLHLLLLMLCLYSQDSRWLKTRIKRKKELPEQPLDSEAQRMADSFIKKGNIKELTNQTRYGKLYLFTEQNSIELPEEISLFDVVGASPAPLRSSFPFEDDWHPPLKDSLPPLLERILVLHPSLKDSLAPLLEHILISLNAKYGLLRSCGLPPQEWDEQFSNPVLLELKALKKRADEQVHPSLHTQYKQAFESLQNEKGKGKAKKAKIAGFDYFDDFLGSDVGAYLLKAKSHLPDEVFEAILPTEDHQHSSDLDAGLQSILHHHPQRFNPVTYYAFEQMIVLKRPLHGADGIFEDAEFRKRLSEHKSYLNLNDKQTAQKLEHNLKTIISKHLNSSDVD